MRTEQIRYLEMILQKNSINKASRELFVSPQALSSSMQNLEKELGFPLLEMTHKGAKLTEKGDVLLKAGLEFLDKIEELQSEEKDIEVKKEKVVLHCVQSVIEIEMPPIFMGLQRKLPQMDLRIIDVAYQDIEDILVHGESECVFCKDIAVNGESVINGNDNLEFVPIKDVGYIYAAINRKCAISQQNSVSTKTLEKYDMIIWDCANGRQLPMGNIVRKLLPQKDYTSVEHISIYAEIMKKSRAVSLCSENQQRLWKNDEVVLVPISDAKIKYMFGYMKYKEVELSAKMQGIIDHILDLLKHNKA